jgi:hypothetical protein
VCAAIHVQRLSRYLTGFGEIEHGVSDILDIDYTSER